LSGGRAVLGVGLGADIDYTAYGEPVSGRGPRLDESLTVLTGLLGGEALDFEGVHLQVHSPPSLPRPVNGSLPIWIGGWWPNPAPFARAARFDGVVPGKVGQERGDPEAFQGGTHCTVCFTMVYHLGTESMTSGAGSAADSS
jgi:alkanesulfonate monooxygenase SsuD/methylene tetrahydromethanopterin reductase-like flavin-dependent oxidoreductase (luciferase family)